MKNFTLVLALLFVSFFSKAQTYVTIPDSSFVNWLSINIPSAMAGNQMDTSNMAVTSLTSMNVSHKCIKNLFGVEYFSGLQVLDCSYNKLDSIISLPDSLKTLNCSNNYLIKIISLPDSIQTFICDRNYLTWLPSLPISITNFSCTLNQLDTLPSLPPFLSNLICSDNLLTRLPILPNSITSINCDMNLLHTLPTLPNSLVSINCQNNLLTSFPAFPDSLKTITCFTNHLTSLPTLPTSLLTLDCYDNQLTGLPALPASLRYLTCSQNPLGVLPALPVVLLELKCYNDSLTVFPTLPSSIIYIDCSNNFLSSLPTLPSSLINLICDGNQITALPSLSSLQSLSCQSNLFSTLPVLPATLQYLGCDHNTLTTLPALASLAELSCTFCTLTNIPAIPSTLSFLNCSNNPIDSLPSLSSLNTIYCTGDHLTSLPTLPGTLSELYCDDNLLTSLPPIPSSTARLSCQNNLITCLPEFPNAIIYLSLYGNPFTCLANYVPAMDSVLLTFPLCVLGDMVNNSHNCANAAGLVGFVYADNNSNCLKDSTDFNLSNMPVKIYDVLGNLIGQTYTASNGVYNFPEPAGTYTATIDTVGIPLSPQCAAPGIDSTVTTTITTPLIADINFDFNCKPGFDVGVQSVVHSNIPFPGQPDDIRIIAGDITQWYHMNCAAGISGTVEVQVTGPVSYVGVMSGALSPTISGTTYTYAISDFATITNVTAFGLKFIIDSTATSLDHVCVNVNVTPVGGDNDSTNNNYNYCYRVVNSHDPNFKETTPEIVPFSFNDYFTYAIHFQNTGTASAMNIHIIDTLDSNLDLSTFQLINYSHANITSLNENVLNVNFPSIMLADSTTSADSSMGFVQYRIKAKPSRPVGTIIRNKGYIYFDYNAPIITNTTFNLYKSLAGINENENGMDASIYPNPSNGVFTLKLVGEKNVLVEVYNIIGEKIISIKTQSESTIIDLTEQAKGVYVMKVIGTKQFFNEKIIKQ
jgi:uncharacterized repeat protein (TIGR01451 family)